ncbi:MAG: hypothetical protein AVDCRST_MAG06-3342, partial [uncultured Nocardioides sp.]
EGPARRGAAGRAPLVRRGACAPSCPSLGRATVSSLTRSTGGHRGPL